MNNATKAYELLPPEAKVRLLESKIGVLLSMAKDIDKNIKNFGLMKEGSMAYADFYKKYYAIFPKEKNGNISTNKKS